MAGTNVVLLRAPGGASSEKTLGTPGPDSSPSRRFAAFVDDRQRRRLTQYSVLGGDESPTT